MGIFQQCGFIVLELKQTDKALIHSHCFKDCLLLLNDVLDLSNICVLWSGSIVLNKNCLRFHKSQCLASILDVRNASVKEINDIKEIYGSNGVAFVVSNTMELRTITDLLAGLKTISPIVCQDCSFSAVSALKNICCVEQDAFTLSDNGIIHKIHGIRSESLFVSHLTLPVKIISVSSGNEHALFLTETGRVFSVGSGTKGQTGLGSTDNVEIPEEVVALEPLKITAIAAGGWHSAALSETGDIYTWGWNESGQLGHGDFVLSMFPKLIDVDLDVTFHTVSCGSRHSAAVSTDGEIWTWGWNVYGQLGLGNTINQATPTKVTSHDRETCLLYKDVKCGPWTTLSYGELKECQESIQ